MAVVTAYAAWWPLSASTLCRTLVAQSHPMGSGTVREFLDRLDAITPEHEATVRRIAESAVAAGLIPKRSVDLRGDHSR
jgi:hypothetical protein